VDSTSAYRKYEELLGYHYDYCGEVEC